MSRSPLCAILNQAVVLPFLGPHSPTLSTLPEGFEDNCKEQRWDMGQVGFNKVAPRRAAHSVIDDYVPRQYPQHRCEILLGSA